MIDYTLPLDQLPDPLPIEPLRKPFDVTITPPGSKSITCRAYVLAALAKGESKIIRPLRADDPDYLLKALCTLGTEARWVPGEDHDGEDVYIKGVGGRFPRGGNLYMGDGGAPTRFMIACACLAAEPVVIDASARMRERPIAEGVEMLRQLGAKIEYVEQEGRLPVRVVPSDRFVGGELKFGRIPSSQMISAILMVGAFMPSGLAIRVANASSASYVCLTHEVMRSFKIRLKRNLFSYFAAKYFRQATVQHGEVNARQYSIEADASSSAYWVLATMLCKGSKCVVERIGFKSAQPDDEALDALELLGGHVDRFEARDYGETGPDHLVVKNRPNRKSKRLQIDCGMMPDSAIVFGVGAACCTGASVVSNLGTLRVKETDRIAALANELRKVGCAVETGEDWIEITPAKDPPAEPGAKGIDHESVVIETYNDHRMAMAFGVLGLVRPGISIRNPACVSKSYPGFWKDFAKLYQ